MMKNFVSVNIYISDEREFANFSEISGIFEKSPHFRSIYSSTNLFFEATFLFFFLSECRRPSCLIFQWKKKRSAVVEQVHLKNKKYLSNVIFVITEFYIFIQRFGLHSGPVTDCTFVGNVLSKSAPQRSMLIFKPDFPDICSMVQGSSMLASAHFSQAGCWVYFVI